MSLQQAVLTAEQNGGVSYNIHSGYMNPDTGYMVSLDGFERHSPELTYHNVLGYVNENIDAFKSNSFVGLWLDEGIWYMDISFCFEGLEEALKFAEDNNQIAIYDNANKKSIYL